MSIFITGGTGTTGRDTIKALQKRGATIRVGARDLAKAKALAGPGTDFVQFDYEKPETFIPAMKGCHTMLLLTGFDRFAHEQATQLIDAAAAAGVKHVVKLSAQGADSVPGIMVGRWHRTAERYLTASGLGWTVVRPGAFASNFAMFWGHSIKTEGKIYLPLGTSKVAWIDPRDTAEILAKVLTEGGHVGKVYELTGPEALDVHQVAKALSDATGKTITYVDVPEKAAAEGMKGAGMPDWAITGMGELYAVWKAGWGATVHNTTEMLLGRKGGTFAQWAKDNANLFK